MRSKFVLAALFLAGTCPAFSQVAPSASGGGLPFVVGAGVSDFSLDFGMGRRMEGVTVWVDWNLYRAPSLLRGLGIEFEGRDIDINRPSSLSRMRQDTGDGGVIYTWRRYRNFHPYAKYLAGIGSIDFPPPFANEPLYTHTTNFVSSPGGGLEYRAFRNIWVRGDYEYQFWPNLFSRQTALNPNGVTIGASYDFRGIHRR
jgi:opacity protein-like surface antigen